MPEEFPRPKIYLKKRPVDVFLETFALICILFMWGYCLFHFASLPNIIPTHYGSHGKPDDYGSRMMIFLVPAITTVIVSGLRFLNRFPHKFNYMTVITEENAERQYRLATTLVRYMQFIISLLFTYIVVKTVNDAYDKKSELGIWFIFILEASLFVPAVYTVYKSLSKK